MGEWYVVFDEGVVDCWFVVVVVVAEELVFFVAMVAHRWGVECEGGYDVAFSGGVLQSRFMRIEGVIGLMFVFVYGWGISGCAR